jgi:hypothetical protein
MLPPENLEDALEAVRESERELIAEKALWMGCYVSDIQGFTGLKPSVSEVMCKWRGSVRTEPVLYQIQ